MVPWVWSMTLMYVSSLLVAAFHIRSSFYKGNACGRRRYGGQNARSAAWKNDIMRSTCQHR
jgi:hypothetical protein